MDSIQLKITGMKCGGCVSSVEKILNNSDGIENVSVNLLTESAYFKINKSYIDIDVNDASGDNMSGIDIKVMEDDVQKYATSYFSGSDPKTDSSGTIATFLIDSKKYVGEICDIPFV